MQQLAELKNTPISIEEVNGLLPMKKIQPKKSKVVRLTQAHGSMRAVDMLMKVTERNAAEKVKEKKEDAAMKKEELRLAFTICKESCHCSNSPRCIISGFKQCSVCLDVLKSQCSKTLCVVDRKKTVMVVAATSTKTKSKPKPLSSSKRSSKQMFKDMMCSEEEEEEEALLEVSGLSELSEDEVCCDVLCNVFLMFDVRQLTVDDRS